MLVPFQDSRNPCKAASCAYGALTCSGTCQLERRVFGWSPNEQERGKNVHSHPTPFLMGRGSGTRVLHIATCPLSVHGWEFCCFPVQFCTRMDRNQLKDSAFFFFFFIPPPSMKLLPREPEPCAGGSQGAWRGRPSFGNLIYFSPVLLLSQASYL